MHYHVYLDLTVQDGNIHLIPFIVEMLYTDICSTMNHYLLRVCIGVGDLYTDPQIHTMDLTEYGEANLGSKGMALFFSSHLCSPLCSALGLTSFDLHDKVQ